MYTEFSIRAKLHTLLNESLILVHLQNMSQAQEQDGADEWYDVVQKHHVKLCSKDHEVGL